MKLCASTYSLGPIATDHAPWNSMQMQNSKLDSKLVSAGHGGTTHSCSQVLVKDSSARSGSLAARLVVLMLAAALTADSVAAEPGWIVSGPNKTTSGVPVCSHCVHAFNLTSAAAEARDLTVGLPVTVWACHAFTPDQAGWEYNAATSSIQLQVLDGLGQTLNLCLDAGTQERYDGQPGSSVSPFRVGACIPSRPEQQWFQRSDERNSGTIRSGLRSPEGQDLYMVQGRLPANVTFADGAGYGAYGTGFSLYLSTEAGFSAAPFMTQQFTFQPTSNYVGASGSSSQLWEQDNVDEDDTNVVHNGGFQRYSLMPAALGRPAPVGQETVSSSRSADAFTLCGWDTTGTGVAWISTGNGDRSNSSVLLRAGGGMMQQTFPTLSRSVYSISLSLNASFKLPDGSDSVVYCEVYDRVLSVRVESWCAAVGVWGFTFPVGPPSPQVNATFTACPGNLTQIRILSTEATGSGGSKCAPTVDNVRVALLQFVPSPNINGSTSSSRSGRTQLVAIVGGLVGSASGLLLVAGMATYCYRYHRRRWRYRHLLQVSPQAHARIRIFSVEQIHKATKNLSPECLLGEGGFGSVYKAHFADGVMGAVKVEKVSPKARKKSSDFAQEVALLQQVHHRNLVNLIGLALDGLRGTLMLVFEFLPNGSLSDRLHATHDGLEPLTWLSRMKIVYQLACALEYLHHGTSPPIVHRDIKSANILLTDTNTAKLADFGLSKAAPAPDATHFSSVETLVRGSFGYLDPQYMSSGVFSSKSDVYSYAVVLLELITGRRAITDGDLLSVWAQEYLEDTTCTIVHYMVDPLLQGRWNSSDLLILVDLVKMCLQNDAQARPTMQQVVSFLTERDFSGVPRAGTPAAAPCGDLSFSEEDEFEGSSMSMHMTSFRTENSQLSAAGEFDITSQ